MGFFDRFVPELVRASQKAQAENPRPVLAASYPEPSNAEKAQGYGIAAWIVQFVCAFISLVLAFMARRLALEELQAIAEAGDPPPDARRRSSASGSGSP